MREPNQDAVVSGRKIGPIIDVCKEEGIKIPVPTRTRDFPEISKKINDKLTYSLLELHLLPIRISTVDEAFATFMQIMTLTKETLRKILVRGEFDEFLDDEMHGTGKLAEMLKQFSDELDQFHHEYGLRDLKNNFLETKINYILNTRDAVKQDHVDDAGKNKEEQCSLMNTRFVNMVWTYIEQVMLDVLMKQIGRYTHLHLEVSSLSYILLGRMRHMTQQEFIYGVLDDMKKPSTIVVEGIGEIEVLEGLRKYSRDVLSRAFCVKMNEIAHWKMFARIFVERLASHLKLSVANLVDTYMDVEMSDMQMLKGPEYGFGLKEMLEKYPLARKDLQKRIEMLKKAKDICDGIHHGCF
ncbi:putative dynamin central domain, Dynamin superfamily [Rosa chinensis]|uniref:Putative dynamin central domain, Dynamin superfamily n=1 Tax=Rosa chinensis TaxID=74649 RepID=A0A2P6PIH9_ROSCH|nr:putative dynamin central domain, Dynamin superfamily [Rosa chinensis]